MFLDSLVTEHSPDEIRFDLASQLVFVMLINCHLALAFTQCTLCVYVFACFGFFLVEGVGGLEDVIAFGQWQQRRSHI